MKLATWDDLSAWLEEEGWFDEGWIFSYSPMPASANPATVELELGRWVDGGMDPGDVMTFRIFRLVATGVNRYSIESPGHIPGNWSLLGVELREEHRGFSISIDTPGLLRLTFQELDVVQLDDRPVVVEPWLSQREFSISAEGGAMPSAKDWIRMVRDLGVKAKWNLCGEDESATYEPAPFGYDGWCLQCWDSGTPESVMFIIEGQGESAGYSVTMDSHLSTDRLWESVCRAAVANPTAVIRTGNVEMNASEWSRYLDEGTLPDPPRGWSIHEYFGRMWEVVDGRQRPRRAASRERPRTTAPPE